MSSDKIMSAKEYLSQAMYIDQRINSKLEQVMTLRESATKVTQVMSDMPRNPGGNQQAMENTIVKIIDLENEINRDIDRLVDLKAEVRQVISQLVSPDQQLVLELRYLCYKSWSDIAAELGFCESNIYKLHGEALKNVVIPVNSVRSEKE